MTRASLREYAVVQRVRYLQATRSEKRRLLDEVVAVTGIHRKAAIRLLRRAARPRPTPGPGGRPREYGPDVAAAATVLWQAAGRIGAHRLHPFVPELLARLVQCDELTVPAPVDKQLRQASVATLKRLLAPARAQYPPRRATLTHPGPSLKHEIPIRTFTEWEDVRPGFLEIDLVGHCGSSTEGFFLCTLYCRRHAITFTRSRPWKKNDRAHVEQKNGAVVRQLVGYDRFASKAAYAQLTRVYALARLHVNFFQPVEKLVRKTREGARAHRTYDRAQTPYQRLCAAGVLPADTRQELERLYHTLNPLQLRRDLEAALERLWTLAAPDPRRQGHTDVATPSRKSAPGGA